MPYAAHDMVSTDPLEDGVEITEQDYQDAITAMMEGKVVVVEDGFELVDPPPEPAPEAPAEPEA